MNFKLQNGQSLIEYTIVLGVVVSVVAALGPMVKRGVQGMVKTAADQIGTQNGAEQDVNMETGYLEESYQKTDSSSNKVIAYGEIPGQTEIYFSDKTSTRSDSNSYVGASLNDLAEDQ